MILLQIVQVKVSIFRRLSMVELRKVTVKHQIVNEYQTFRQNDDLSNFMQPFLI